MQQIEFNLDRDHVQLNQLLKLTGLADSGGAGKALVATGAIRVDGEVELRKTAKIRAGQTVTFIDVEIKVVGGTLATNPAADPAAGDDSKPAA